MRWRLMSILFLIPVLASIALPAAAQSTPIHEEILRTYNFQPHSLSKAEIAQKSVLLDEFWKKAKSQSTDYLPALRNDLSDFKSPPFFLYDGSMLLLSLSNSAEDRQIALAAMAHCDLRDVQPTEYFLQTHRLATLGANTTATAFHVLGEPKFTVFIPQHALTLGQNYSLVYMLLPTDQEFWTQAAIDRLRTEKDEVAQKSLILLLWYAQTESADKSIAEFAADSTKPMAVREYTKHIIQAKSKLDAKQRTEAGNLTEAALREKRRERMKAVSDEALIDLDEYTMMLATKRK